MRKIYNKAYQIIIVALLLATSFSELAVPLTVNASNHQLSKSIARSNPESSHSSDFEYVPGVILIGLAPSVTLEDISSQAISGSTFDTNSDQLGQLLQALSVQSVMPVYGKLDDQEINALGSLVKETNGVFRLTLPESISIEETIKEFENIDDVLFAEPDYIAYAIESSTPTPNSDNALIPTDTATQEPTSDCISTESPNHPIDPISIDTHNAYENVEELADPVVNDPLFNQQWGLSKINIEPAWSQTMGNSSSTIAIIDSGIDTTHPDLVNNLWINPGEIANNGLDDDNNGFIDDLRGWNFVNKNNDIADDSGHGTLVAGVAAAIGNNGIGTIGVCPDCRIMPIKVLNSSGTANYSDIAAAVLYAAQKGARVINLSLGGYVNSNTLRSAIDTAVDSYGVVIVAGTGNDSTSTLFYPAAYEKVLSVSGTQSDDLKANSSNYGTWVDLSAPSTEIMTTALGNDWALGSGTSMSAPFVSGMAGLLKSLHPEWTQITVRSQLIYTADNVDVLNPGFEGMLGYGRANAAATMADPKPLLFLESYSIDSVVGGSPLLGVPAQLAITLRNDWWNAQGVAGIITTTDPKVNITNGNINFGDIPGAGKSSNIVAASFVVDNTAGYGYPIVFTLNVSDANGYSNSYDFTVYTTTNIVTLAGTQYTSTWTSDKTYVVTGNIGVPPGNTLTIMPGTVVKFNANTSLDVGGTLIASGTEDRPIKFISNTASTWNGILFNDTGSDSIADEFGSYLSGSILQNVKIENSATGITCANATPYINQLTSSAGITCTLGSTEGWILDSSITGAVILYGSANVYRNSISSDLRIAKFGTIEANTVGGVISLDFAEKCNEYDPECGPFDVGTRIARGNTSNGLEVYGEGGYLEANDVRNGPVIVGNDFQVINNTIADSLTTGDNATVRQNKVRNGISVGNSCSLTWNDVENGTGTGIQGGTNTHASFNRVINHLRGMVILSGTIEHNLIANNKGPGLQVGEGTIRFNSLTGNWGNSVTIRYGTPSSIQHNNFENNYGDYDLFLDIPSGSTIPVQSNWWGTTDTNQINSRIYDSADDYTKAAAALSSNHVGPDIDAPGYIRSVAVLPDSVVGIQTATFQAVFSRPMDTNFHPNVSFTRPVFKQIDVGREHICALKDDGTVVCWGASGVPDTNVPSGTYIQVDVGERNACALKANGTIICWHHWYSTSTERFIPSGVYSQISVGSEICGLATDGTIQCWHWKDEPAGPYTGKYKQVSAGFYNVCGLRTDGMIKCWDNNQFGNSNVPVGVYTQVSAGWTNSCGLKNDGTIACWGNDDRITSNVPSGAYKQVSVEHTEACALRMDGRIDCWGLVRGWYPGDSFVHVAAGEFFTCALRGNGSVVCWGGFSSLNDFKPANLSIPVLSFPVYYAENASSWVTEDVYTTSYDVTSSIPRAKYIARIEDAIDPDGMHSQPFTDSWFTVDFAVSISDKTAPKKPTVTVSNINSLNSISASWSSSDAESPIDKYRYAIGTTPGARDVVAWTYVSPSTKSILRSGLSLEYGKSYYVSVGARNTGGLWSENGISNSITPTLKVISISPKCAYVGEASKTISFKGAYFAPDTIVRLNDADKDTVFINGTSLSTALTASELDSAGTQSLSVYVPSQGGAISNIVPFPVVNHLPENGIEYYSNKITIDWDDIPGATLYSFQLSQSPTFSTTIISTSLSSSKYTYSTLQNGIRYYWRIRPKIGGVYESWSPTWNFLSIYKPFSPVLTFPVSGLITNNTTPELDWNSVVSAQQYQVQVGTSSYFTTVVQDQILDYNTRSYICEALGDGKYYWRVRAINPNGVLGTWSVVRYFTVDTLPPAIPVLLSPAEDSIVQTTVPKLSVVTSAGAKTYRYQVVYEENFAIPLIDTIRSTTYLVPTTSQALPLGVISWRVCATDAAGNTSDWSAIGRFNVNILKAPSNNSYTTITKPVFSWAAAAGGLEYRLQVSDKNDFSTLILDMNRPPSTSYTPSVAFSHGHYFWRMQVRTSTGWGNWSLPFKFTVSPAFPPAPVLTSPIPGLLTNDNTPTLSWQAPINAVGYKIQISKSSYFTTLEQEIVLSNELSYTPTPLSDGKHYWRVRALNYLTAPGTWSVARSITIDTTPPLPPVLSLPKDSVTVRGTPTYSWLSSTGASRYQFRYGTSGDFLDPIYTSVELTLLSHKPPLQSPSNPIYYWQVRAKDTAGNWGNWSNSRTITILPTIPVAPSLVTPVGGSIVTSPRPVFVWKSVPYGVTYQLQIDDNSSFSSLVDTVETENLSTITRYLFNKTYYWRVRAVNEDDEVGAWSSARSVIIKAPLDVDPPFNPTEVASSSHQINIPSNNQVIVMNWSGDATDGAGSGLAGYEVKWS